MREITRNQNKKIQALISEFKDIVSAVDIEVDSDGTAVVTLYWDKDKIDYRPNSFGLYPRLNEVYYFTPKGREL